MEANQPVSPSPETSWIPQGIPTGVFVPNNQTPAQQAPVAPVTATTPAWTPAAPAKEGPLDKFLKWLAKFLAKVTGQPDPITWAPNIASKAIAAWENVVGKVRGVANQAVGKATTAATKIADTTTNVVSQAAQKIIPQTAPQTPAAPTQPVPEQPK